MDIRDQNTKQVLANDNDIRRQVPGIVQKADNDNRPAELHNEELFFRANNR